MHIVRVWDRYNYLQSHTVIFVEICLCKYNLETLILMPSNNFTEAQGTLFQISAIYRFREFLY